MREEPVVFVGLNHDYVPYSPRDPSSLKGNIANHGVKPEELADNELKIREEVKKLQKIVSIAVKELIFPVLLYRNQRLERKVSIGSVLLFSTFFVLNCGISRHYQDEKCKEMKHSVKLTGSTCRASVCRNGKEKV